MENLRETTAAVGVVLVLAAFAGALLATGAAFAYGIAGIEVLHHVPAFVIGTLLTFILGALLLVITEPESGAMANYNE